MLCALAALSFCVLAGLCWDPTALYAAAALHQHQCLTNYTNCCNKLWCFVTWLEALLPALLLQSLCIHRLSKRHPTSWLVWLGDW